MKRGSGLRLRAGLRVQAGQEHQVPTTDQANPSSFPAVCGCRKQADPKVVPRAVRESGERFTVRVTPLWGTSTS